LIVKLRQSKNNLKMSILQKTIKKQLQTITNQIIFCLC
jgi:hypothetical protein